MTSSTGIDAVVRRMGRDWEAHRAPIKVMISSPLARLKIERDAIEDELKAFSKLDVELFEKKPDSGTRNVDESVDLASRCDLMIALFDPSYPGSVIAKKDRPQGYESIEHYSQLELEIASRRYEESAMPRILIFSKDGLPTPGTWQSRFVDQYSGHVFANIDHLRALIRFHVVGNVVAFLFERARYLAEQARELETNDRLREQSLSAISQENDDLRERVEKLRTDYLQQIESHRNISKVTQEALVESHTRARNALEQHIEQLSTRLKEKTRSVVAQLLIGSAMGALPVILFAAVVIGSHVIGGIDRAIATHASTVASAAAYQPVHVHGLPMDPMSVVRKVDFARALTNGKFSCDEPGRSHWEVSSISPGRLFIDRDSVCISSRSLVLEATSVPYESCGHKSPLDAKSWRRMVESALSKNLRIEEVRLIGHASVPRIRSSCGQLSEAVFRSIPESARSELEMSDLYIRTNAQLAYARAKEMEIVIREVDGTITTWSETLGIFQSRSDDKGDRRVTVSLRVGSNGDMGLSQATTAISE